MAISSSTLLPQVSIHEIGTAAESPFLYPAVPVGWEHIPTSIGASFGQGEAFGYGHSVDQGSLELQYYLVQRRIACPSTLFVLGGYSQGAQVVSEALNERLNFLCAETDWLNS